MFDALRQQYSKISINNNYNHNWIKQFYLAVHEGGFEGKMLMLEGMFTMLTEMGSC